jgi:hypothetical protein
MNHRPENDPFLTKYLRKLEKKGGQLSRKVREERLNAVFDFVEEMDLESYKIKQRITHLRFRALPRILIPPPPVEEEVE